MKTYEFDVVLEGLSEISDELADALYQAGCDDGTPASRDGITWLHFDRTALTLEEAIRSALQQIQKTGLVVARLEIAGDAAATLMK